MKLVFVSINDNSDVANGTSLQGHITAAYEDLVAVFGPPGCGGDGYKTDVEWVIVFDDGTVATIYNWKNGRNYCGASGKPVEMITYWNVGGHNSKAVAQVMATLLKYIKVDATST